VRTFRTLLLCLSAGWLNASATADDSAVSTSGTKASPAPSRPTITFTTKSGEVISNAEIIRTNTGVSLVWEKDGGASGGVVRLENLPEDLQSQFGYDADKTAAADKLAADRRAQLQQEEAAAALVAQKTQTNAAPMTNSLAVNHATSTSTTNSPAKKQTTTPHRRHMIL